MSYDAPQPPAPQPPGQSPNPYGQSPGPYGQSPDPYGQSPDPYGQQPHGYGQQAPGYGAPYAHWGRRVGSSIVDGLVPLPFFALAVVFFVLSREETPTRTVLNARGEEVAFGTDVSFGGPFLVLAIVLYLAALAFAIWNTIVRQGRTGRSIGKSALGTVLLKEETGRPLGAGMTFVRAICHVVDGFFYLGYLWPLWDAKRQTFADKIVGTVVLDQPRT